MKNEIKQHLDKLNITCQYFTHEPVTSVDRGKEIYAHEGIEGIHVKNLFLRNKKGSQHYLLTVMADKEIDLKKISELVEDRKLGFASEDRLWKYLEIKPGSVSPLALVNDTERHVKVVFDEDIFKNDKIHIHPGINSQSVVMDTKDLQMYVESLSYEIFYIETT